MSAIIGIDLGTTNSAFAYLVAGKPEIITNKEGNRTTPSVVANVWSDKWLSASGWLTPRIRSTPSSD